ncbi:hypothetical protein GGG16DRAFT_107012, partial [Schizophyllum commune]
ALVKERPAFENYAVNGYDGDSLATSSMPPARHRRMRRLPTRPKYPIVREGLKALIMKDIEPTDSIGSGGITQPSQSHTPYELGTTTPYTMLAYYIVSAMRRRGMVLTVDFTRLQTAGGLRGHPRVLAAYTKGAWSRLATRFSGSLSDFLRPPNRRRHARGPSDEECGILADRVAVVYYGGTADKHSQPQSGANTSPRRAAVDAPRNSEEPLPTRGEVTPADCASVRSSDDRGEILAPRTRPYRHPAPPKGGETLPAGVERTVYLRLTKRQKRRIFDEAKRPSPLAGFPFTLPPPCTLE